MALGLSGLWHGAALALALAAGVFQPGAERDAGPVAEVRLMSAAAFDAMISAAPEVAASPPPAPPPVEGMEGVPVVVPEVAIDGDRRRMPGALADAPMTETTPQEMPDPAGPGPVADALLATAPALAESGVLPAPAAPAQAERAARVSSPPAKLDAPAAEAAPDAKRTAVPAKKPRAAVPEAPSGSGRVASGAGTERTAKASPGAEKSLLADWGGSLRRKVERARQSPAGAKGQTGKVTLRLSVAVSGTVLGVAVLRSSGVAALDRAAVDAVRRAGRLPKAPKGLTAASYDFNLPVVFTR